MDHSLLQIVLQLGILVPGHRHHAAFILMAGHVVATEDIHEEPKEPVVEVASHTEELPRLGTLSATSHRGDVVGEFVHVAALFVRLLVELDDDAERVVVGEMVEGLGGAAGVDGAKGIIESGRHVVELVILIVAQGGAAAFGVADVADPYIALAPHLLHEPEHIGVDGGGDHHTEATGGQEVAQRGLGSVERHGVGTKETVFEHPFHGLVNGGGLQLAPQGFEIGVLSELLVEVFLIVYQMGGSQFVEHAVAVASEGFQLRIALFLPQYALTANYQHILPTDA